VSSYQRILTGFTLVARLNCLAAPSPSHVRTCPCQGSNMASKSDSTHKSITPAAGGSNPGHLTEMHDEIPPVYYDSEPSSQPPKYPSLQQNPSVQPPPPSPPSQTLAKPSNPHRNSAPASTIAAILASPHEDLDAQRRADRKKKTFRERWRDFKDRNFHDDGGGEDKGPSGASAAELNVMGGSLKGGQTNPYRKK